MQRATYAEMTITWANSVTLLTQLKSGGGSSMLLVFFKLEPAPTIETVSLPDGLH